MPPSVDPATFSAALAARRETLEPYPRDRFSGDGIVICAGGASIFTNAYVLVHVLRTALGCVLPIEVWHFGTDEMSARMRLLLRELSAEPIDADAVMAARSVQLDDGWQLKSFALCHSSFARVLLLDADIVPERDPADLFGWPEFEATGAVFWPDICAITAANKIWAACGLAPRTTRALESGQILIDKSRHWDALQIIVCLNLQDRQAYRMVYGDKDLFLIGFLVMNSPFQLVPHVPFTDWGCLFQTDFSGKRLFQHRTGAKWRYRGPQPVVHGFRHLEACEEALKTLRRKWTGRVFNAPARSTAALAEEVRLSSIRTVVLVVPGESSATFDLLEGGDITDGGKSGPLHWFCADGDPVELVLRDRFDQSTTFKAAGPGRWIEDCPGLASTLVESREPRPVERATAPEKYWDSLAKYYRFDDEI